MHEVYGMAGHLIRRLNQISTSIFADRLSAAGFDVTSVQFAALTCIESNPGIDQARLAGAIAYDRATIGGVVDRLENKGYVERKIAEHDRRARCLLLTDHGKEQLSRMTPIVRALQDDILCGLDREEKEELLRLLRKVTDAGNDLSRAPIRKASE
jgi:MarR family transcriptional regulator, temperature-dependent positive regulator of motility